MSNLSKEVKELLEKYFLAASNLYGIIPLSKLLDIYNSQNPPISEEEFLTFADGIDERKMHCYIAGEEEFYYDILPVKPIDRDLIAEHLVIDEDDLDLFYNVKESQIGKPYYIPDKDKFLRFADECYVEKTLSFISVRAFFRNFSGFDKERADELAGELYICGNIFEGRIEPVLGFLKEYRIDLDMKTMEEFISLYTEMYNDTRLHVNRGHSPNEMIDMM